MPNGDQPCSHAHAKTKGEIGVNMGPRQHTSYAHCLDLPVGGLGMLSLFPSETFVSGINGGRFESLTSSGVVLPSFLPFIVVVCDSPSSFAAASNSSTFTPSLFVGA